jgi:NitT/TauT family transport system substrate-binding protein
LLLTLACAAPALPAANQAVAASGPGVAAAAPAPTELNYASTTLGWNLAPQIIAKEKGFFAGEGLSVETVITGQSATVCQQLLARAVEVGGCSLNDMIQTVESSNAPLALIVQETVSVLHNGLMVRPGLTSYADLKGKTIMLGGPKDNTVYFFRVMARAHGLRDDDYDMVYAGSSSARYAALQAGGVDASLLTDPFDYQIEQEGFQRFDNLRPRYIREDTYSGNGTIVRKDWAAAHVDETVRYVRAMLRTLAWLNDPANKDELFAIVGPRLNLSAETFERIYRRAVIDSQEWSTDGRAQPSAYAGVLKSLVDLGYMSEPVPAPTKYYDMTYVEQAHQSLDR